MQVQHRFPFSPGLARCAGVLLTAWVLTACGEQAQAGDVSPPQLHQSESEIRYIRSADEFVSGVAQLKATRSFRSFGLQITADPSSVLEYQVLSTDGTWSAWLPVKLDENNGRYRGGHQVLSAPATEVRIRASVPADFLRFELFPGTQQFHDDDEWLQAYGLGDLSQQIARPGIWTPSAETLRIGDTMYLPYESADSCYGSLRPGTKELGDFILAHFPGATSYGGYACRDIVGAPGVLSVHATGRALDIFVPVDGASSCTTCADNDKGDPLAKWLIENAEYIGFSYVIWDRADWGANQPTGSKWGSYGGSHPHHDHLHIEISSKAAAKQTGWFLDGKPWNPGTKATRFEAAGKWASGLGGSNWSGVGDFNGDGKSDLAWYEAWNNGSISVLLSNGSSFALSGKWASGLGGADWVGVGDFNGDRKSDIVWYEGWNNASFTVLLSTGTGFTLAGKWASGIGGANWAGVGDFNGDGKADIAWYEAWNNGSITLLRSTGTGFSLAGKWASGIAGADWAGVGDFNGDGKSDLAWYEAWNGNSVSVFLSAGTTFSLTGKWASGLGGPDLARVGDFTGDGKADLAWYEHWNNGSITVLASTGNSLSLTGKWLSGWAKPDWAGVGDFDGDRRMDFAWYEIWNSNSVSVGLAR